MSRLRAQLERLQNEKAEDTTSKSNDAMKRLQKQMRDIREELQEAEKKEQEQNKKRRAAVSDKYMILHVCTCTRIGDTSE